MLQMLKHTHKHVKTHQICLIQETTLSELFINISLPVRPKLKTILFDGLVWVVLMLYYIVL